MTRTELSEKICNAVISGEKLTKEEIKLRSKCNNDSYKSGLYFLYNDLNECIYVGQTGVNMYRCILEWSVMAMQHIKKIPGIMKYRMVTGTNLI